MTLNLWEYGLCLCILFLTLESSGLTDRKVKFSGYDWDVRDTNEQLAEPGPNVYSPNNSYVDEEGRLHLMLTKTEDPFLFRCAQVHLPLELGYGTYQFEFDQDIHHFGRHDNRGDPNVILGLWLFQQKKFNAKC